MNVNPFSKKRKRKRAKPLDVKTGDGDKMKDVENRMNGGKASKQRVNKWINEGERKIYRGR